MKNNYLYFRRSKIIHAFLLLGVLIGCSSWGFFAHKQINHHAVFSLPSNMIRFYKSNIDFIAAHSVDPDKRRYVDSLEGPRHFLDVDRYGANPFGNIPQKWDKAVAKYSEQKLLKNGTVPWQIQKNYRALVDAFQAKDSLRILKLSADLGHYIADAHVPLHTTENYNGQLTKQVGIHALWESRLPELFAHKYNYVVGIAQYIDNPLAGAWKIVECTFRYKDSVLLIEARLNGQFAADKKYSYSKRRGKLTKQYAEAYAQTYHEALNGMVEQQMRLSIHKVASFWYSAWVDAGQPDLTTFNKTRLVQQVQSRARRKSDLDHNDGCR